MTFITNIINSIKKALAPNRLAAIVVFLSALSAQIAALAGVFPAGSKLATALVPVAALVAQAVTVVKWLQGWQLHEARQAILPVQYPQAPLAPASTPVDPVPADPYPPVEDVPAQESDALGPIPPDGQ